MTSDARCDVLIVEDSAIQCNEMAEYLRHAGLAVAAAYDARTALAHAQALEPPVLVLDYNLPDMNGVQLAEALRALLPSAAILMMSGRIDGLSEETLQALGITVFLNKPVPLGPLRNAVLRLARPSRTAKEAPERKPGWLSAGLGGTRR